MKKIFLCAINNISSGNCSQDCKFCTQSAKNSIDIDKYRYKNIETIVQEAKRAYANKAIGYCLVTAGKGLDDKSLEFVTKSARAVKKALPSLSLIGCNGLASKEQLLELKKAGIDNYNHNLESSKEFYPSIVSTHKWEQRYQTSLNVKEAGLRLCSGGIFGLGESMSDRNSLINSITQLKPHSIPINFFISNDSLPINQPKITQEEAVEIIKKIRVKNPNAMIMIAGGRELIFGNNYKNMFDSGADAIVIGDYLTTNGFKAKHDLDMIDQLGLSLATNCD